MEAGSHVAADRISPVLTPRNLPATVRSAHLIQHRLQVICLTPLQDSPVVIELEHRHDNCGYGRTADAGIADLLTITVVPELSNVVTSTRTPPTAVSWVVSSDLMASAPSRTPCGSSTQIAVS